MNKLTTFQIHENLVKYIYIHKLTGLGSVTLVLYHSKSENLPIH